jgi:hypothetical protein
MKFKTSESLRNYLIEQMQKGYSLHKIQREKFTNAKVGTLSRIMNDPTYEPMHFEIREALHMSEACSRCRRSFHHIHQSAPAKPLTAWRRWWRRLSKNKRNSFIRELWRQK